MPGSPVSQDTAATTSQAASQRRCRRTSGPATRPGRQRPGGAPAGMTCPRVLGSRESSPITPPHCRGRRGPGPPRTGPRRHGGPGPSHPVHQRVRDPVQGRGRRPRRLSRPHPAARPPWPGTSIADDIRPPPCWPTRWPCSMQRRRPSQRPLPWVGATISSARNDHATRGRGPVVVDPRQRRQPLELHRRPRERRLVLRRHRLLLGQELHRDRGVLLAGLLVGVEHRGLPHRQTGLLVERCGRDPSARGSALKSATGSTAPFRNAPIGNTSSCCDPHPLLQSPCPEILPIVLTRLASQICTTTRMPRLASQVKSKRRIGTSRLAMSLQLRGDARSRRPATAVPAGGGGTARRDPDAQGRAG